MHVWVEDGKAVSGCGKKYHQAYHQVSADEAYGDLPLDRPDLFFTEETFRSG